MADEGKGRIKIPFNGKILLKLLGLQHFDLTNVSYIRRNDRVDVLELEIYGWLPQWANEGDSAEYIIRGECPAPELIPEGPLGREHYEKQYGVWMEADRQWKEDHAKAEGESAGT